MQSHGPISAAVIFAFGWAGLAMVNNVSLKRHPGWDYAELSTICWGELGCSHVWPSDGISPHDV